MHRFIGIRNICQGPGVENTIKTQRKELLLPNQGSTREKGARRGGAVARCLRLKMLTRKLWTTPRSNFTTKMFVIHLGSGK